MTIRLFASALFAGLAAGLIAVLLQGFLMERLILEAEEYESGAKVHFAGVPGATDDAAVSAEHDHTTHEHAEPEDSGIFHRFSLAFAADFIVFVAWGLVMVAGFAVAERLGRPVTIYAALLWGIGGFAAVHILPGIGLPPELPGIPAADLAARQFWWIATVVASIVGLGLIGYSGKNPFMVGFGVIILALPHLIGAPVLDSFAGVAPPELAGEYVARSYAVAFFAWITLGLTAGYFWNRGKGDARDPRTMPR